MSEAESPRRRAAGGEAAAVTVDDVRTLVAAATPHFALQVRNRVARLVADLPADDPAAREGRRQIARLTELGRSGEVRGTPPQPGMAPLRSVTPPEG